MDEAPPATGDPREAGPALGDPALPGVTLVSDGVVTRLRAALAAKGPGHTPRTRHLTPEGGPRFTNRLIAETSPYLLQHAHNPVNWFPWGDAAFERARRDNRPVLLSVGYSTCHWCHVMERESFEDLEIARFINEHFVAIKVDREERPDVDAVYMNAVHLLGSRGGWPMTVVLTPQRQPFFAGTYFPARDGDRGAHKGLLTILGELADLYRTDPERVVATARRVTGRLQAEAAPARPGDLAGPDAIRAAVVNLARRFDPVNGGFGGAPKFPTPSNLALVARYFHRTQDPQALTILARTLEKMAAGGIYDHVGGGFHRYATDAAWGVPHFEKMLYDNAQLAVAYLDGYQLTGRADFAGVARETLDYVAREMTDATGGFHSATDADSPAPGGDEPEEGRFFTWTPAELRAALDPEAARAFAAYYGVTERGNLDGRSVLHVGAPLASVAATLGVTPAQLDATLGAARATLFDVRARRPPPLRDDKIIAAWNGLMISAFARGAAVLGEPRYLERATAAAEHVIGRMLDGDLLARTWNDGRTRSAGVLDDYAFVAQGLLDLYEAGHDVRWLREAITLQAAMDRRFLDAANGGYFSTPAGDAGVLTREKPDYDGAEPSGNAVALLNLLRLEEFTGDDAYRQAAERGLRAFSRSLTRGGGVSLMLCALDYLLDRPLEVVIVSVAPGAGAALDAALRTSYLPNRIVVQATEGEDLARQAALVPLVADKRVLSGRATAFVCRGRVCEQPTGDPGQLAAQLAKTEPLFEVAPAPLPAPVRGR